MPDIHDEPPGFDELEPEGDLGSRPEDLEAVPLGAIEAEDPDERFLGWGRESIERPEHRPAAPGTGAEELLAAPASANRPFAYGARQAAPASDEQPVNEYDDEEEREGWQPLTTTVRLSVELHSASLREEMALMRSLAKMASRSARADDAAAYICASVPLALGRYPELHGALTPLLPALLQAASRLSRGWHGTANGQARLRSFPTLLENTLGHLAAAIRRGRPVSPSAAGRILLQLARSSPSAA